MKPTATTEAERPNTDLPDFVTEADWIPNFWNFLLGLDHDDLVAELVQNDLDQQATRTVITFEQDRLVCVGDGKPVDADGWRRLRMIHGAGDSVPAKRHKIGVKNHGLKAAFTIGDEIQIFSAGKTITQTLYAYGKDKPPRPGASPEPRLSSEAPSEGCRVVIGYRTSDLEPREGEAIRIGLINARTIADLFLSACATIPEQFAGIVSPEVAPQYEIVIRHWQLGEARFRFFCSHPRNVGKNMETFRRRCEVAGSVDSLPDDLEEEATRRLIPLTGRLKERISDFFRRGNRFFVEVSWLVDRRGKPKPGVGRFRYPIGYPQTSHESRTGHGVFFNAPVLSDTERHGPARNDPTNEELRQACEGLLLDVIARRTAPKWGPDSLKPLVPSPGSTNQDEAVRPLLAALAKRGAIPTMTWKNALRFLTDARRLKKGTDRDAVRVAADRQPARYQFVVPIATWNNKSVDSALAVVCPSSERQLDPRIDPGIIRLIGDGKTPGFGEDFVTFDEYDAVCLAKGESNQYFAISDNRNELLAKPAIARAYLDVIKNAIDKGSLQSEGENELQDSFLLPDTRAEAVPFHESHSSLSVPSNIPGLQLPSLLHPYISSHPLFRRKLWRRPTFTMSTFLDTNQIDESDENTRREFWAWLRTNEKRIRPQERNRLVAMSIWPDANNELCKLTDLCDPRSRSVADVLRKSLHIPHEQVRRLKLTVVGKNRRSLIRRAPSKGELTDWLDSRIQSFSIDEIATDKTAEALDRFESEVVILLKDQSAARALNAVDRTLPSLAEDGSIRWRNETILPDAAIRRLALPARFILRRNRYTSILQKLAPAISGPTLNMLMSALEEDNLNFGALQARLSELLALTKPGDERLAVGGMPIVPVGNEAYAPFDLAFTGTKGDYWGSWKTRLSAKGLSQDDQRRYLDIGVIAATPIKSEASREFFEWLSEQPQEMLEPHIPCVLRHIRHPSGPQVWAEAYTDIPFIPVRSQNGLRLVSLKMARHGRVYLEDSVEVSERVLNTDSRVLLVVDKAKEVIEPVSENLRAMGVRSLRTAFREPEHIKGNGEILIADGEIPETLERLMKTHRTLLKRLVELGVDSELIWHDWFDRISRIREIRFAQEVEGRYLFLSRKYTMSIKAGFDPSTGTFWIRKSQQDSLSSFCEAVAADLIFKSAARPVHLLALERALQTEIRDQSFGRPSQVAEPEAEREGFDNDTDGREITDGEADPGQAVFGHSPFEPNPSRNLPTPSTIVSTSLSEIGTVPWLKKGGSSSVPPPALETEHIELLKTGHYASHCQMCLCEHLPADLAPVGSYVEWEEVRRRIVEAHHVDPKSGGGARHAGNLILLCKLHHDNYGRRLTRESVTIALRKATRKKVVRFGVDGSNLSDLSGRVVEVAIPDTGEIVSIFFTDEHARYWLSQKKRRLTK